jgi:glutamate carboxypeptidase
LVVERKGVTSFLLTCTGVRGHSGSAYLKCASAIQEICQRITQLYNLRDDEREISINIGIIEGGTAENVVSDFAQAKGEFRYYDQPYQAELIEKISAICEAQGVPDTHTSVTFGAAHPALRRTPQSLALAEQARAIAKCQGRELRLETTGGAGDIAIAGLSGIPVLDGLGIEGFGAHTINEEADAISIIPQVELAEELIHCLIP